VPREGLAAALQSGRGRSYGLLPQTLPRYRIEFGNALEPLLEQFELGSLETTIRKGYRLRILGLIKPVMAERRSS
jgi:hypothetical protein